MPSPQLTRRWQVRRRRSLRCLTTRGTRRATLKRSRLRRPPLRQRHYSTAVRTGRAPARPHSMRRSPRRTRPCSYRPDTEQGSHTIRYRSRIVRRRKSQLRSKKDRTGSETLQRRRSRRSPHRPLPCSPAYHSTQARSRWTARCRWRRHEAHLRSRSGRWKATRARSGR